MVPETPSATRFDVKDHDATKGPIENQMRALAGITGRKRPKRQAGRRVLLRMRDMEAIVSANTGHS